MISERRRKVFICYSHADRGWLERLQVHLKPVTRDFDIGVWADTDIRAGSQWHSEIQKALDESDAAVLLISADFLASDFIHEVELPQLLHAAAHRRKRILPVIVAPCLFLRHQDLSGFRTVNDPAFPLIAMPRSEAEAVLRDVAVEILDLKEIPISPKPARIDGREDFLSSEGWGDLAKIGNWILDPTANHILGSGMNTYLLSRSEFGEHAFSIDTIVSFTPLPMTGRAAQLGMNAGLIIGYVHAKPNPRYVHVAFTGKELFVERIGFQGGSTVRDYAHATPSVPCIIPAGEPLHVQIMVSSGLVSVTVDENSLLDAEDLFDVQGRVGLRPWRSTAVCSKFIVENA